MDNLDIKFGKRNQEIADLKATIRQQTCDLFDRKKAYSELFERNEKLCHDRSDLVKEIDDRELRIRDMQERELDLRNRSNAYLQAGRYACGDDTSADPVDVVRNLWKHVL